MKIIIVVMPAYNAEQTLERTCRENQEIVDEINAARTNVYCLTILIGRQYFE